MTQRTRSGGTPKSAAMAGNAMFIVESSEMTSAPTAAIQRITGLLYRTKNIANVVARPRDRRWGGSTSGAARSARLLAQHSLRRGPRRLVTPDLVIPLTHQ